jgi:hypothetical protein
MLELFRQTFGTEPKTKSQPYQRPHPENYEYISSPLGFSDDSRSTLEHIGQFRIQCGETTCNDICKMKSFPLSLSAVHLLGLFLCHLT